ncbi:periplasmic binding protein-like I [Dissophora ornata]|nr:periplasmic binding protein-like I [Dissophora ornata]
MLTSSDPPLPEGSDGDYCRVFASTATTRPRRKSRISRARLVIMWISLYLSIFLTIAHGHGQGQGQDVTSTATSSSYTPPPTVKTSTGPALPNVAAFLPDTPQFPAEPPPDSMGPGWRYVYDPPYHAPGLTDEEFNETWWGLPNTLKIGVLLPFTVVTGPSNSRNFSRISLSVLRMAVQDMNDRQIIPGMNMSLVVRDSQQYLTGTNITGTAAAVSATTRLLQLDIGGAIGDVTADLTTSEAIMTSSIGIPQCSFSSYRMDASQLSTFAYLFRTAPGLQMYLRGLAEVITHYGWRRISILHTLDVEGLTSENSFTNWCKVKNIEMVKVSIPLTEDGSKLEDVASGPMNMVKNSNTRIHVLIAPKESQIALLDIARNNGLFEAGHVWMTTVDLSDSVSELRNPSDFNGLIMADAFWNMPGLPAFESFVSTWSKLNQTKYPGSGRTQLTWHETFTYTCLQVMAESYRALVLDAMEIPDATQRNQTLSNIMHGNRSQDLTLKSIGSMAFNTPIGTFSINQDGDPLPIRVSIVTFQNSKSVTNGVYVNENLDVFNPIVFKNGDTSVPSDSPTWAEVNPDIDSALGLSLTILSSMLVLIIVITAGIVIYNRENIIIKSASPLFCTIELCGIALTLTYVFLRVDVPTEATCKVGATITVIGFTINLSAIVVKNYRIYRIFNSVSVINHAVSNQYLLRVTAIPVILTTIPCIIRSCIYRLEPEIIQTSNDEYWLICGTSEPQVLWLVLIGVTPVVMLLFAIYLAFKTHNVRRLWNEARSIAFTIYTVTFFFVLIIIVQSFPKSLYQVTYPVTMACIIVTCFVEYIVLFYPKLRNLWLQKRGMHVAAGREGTFMDTAMGGAGVLNGGCSILGGASCVLVKQYDGRHGRSSGGGGRGGPFTGSDSASGSSRDMQGNPDISDLVSSYPFGQISGEGNDNLMTSPVHRPTIYGSSHTLTNRGRRRSSSNNERDQHEMDYLDLSDVPKFSLRLGHLIVPQSNNLNGAVGSNTGLTDCDNSRMASESMTIETGGYDTFGHVSTLRNSRDSQPRDLHAMLMASSSRRNRGMLTADGNFGNDHHPLMTSINMADHTRDDLFGAISEMGPDSRNSSFGGVEAVQRPKLFPLQSTSAQNGKKHSPPQSGLFSFQETRMDSYSVTVPVQRHRWYIMRFLAQWRMSSVVFVPHSRLLVIVDKGPRV